MKFLRLKKRKEFLEVLKKGKRAHSHTVTVVFLPAAETKAAVCVGKKYGKSVVRNRIKRLLREALRAQNDLLSPTKILLIPKVAEEYSFANFERDVRRTLIRENLVETQLRENLRAES